ncbi:glycine betaine ABC transporter substrate-binding protein [Burkholderia ubonensis]|uniref:Glycine/betaine ABC transporter substrate-binding protein n=1 Tax=Burkholderia ubonensis TaxID=101571 RepID=A0AB74D9Q9_9BURK|nr:glycine betaine ABC transporter substrate-binding protein [Burkholderia ubonensis]PAJ78384.1 glycine/betaine ABC transporter substrate-binding protein [Burkholderia ubonensis]PAJ84908.1 glycine/betaine ABC transporter substrate-binding protein [Burkholderia ubonensis]PAJ91820.1 glycine/betaine ABC transporter substrate-binding protein [Burkholderia ubonensis]PAJ98828.1 glycine/betaine ABC transporter substrate-binding protein [Burkholderia ubonensis]PAK04120.1 glycine/betaine ABC transporte
MKSSVFQSLVAKLTVSAVIAFGVGVGPAVAAEPIKVAVTNWADVLAVANVAKYVLETKLKQPVQFVQADIGIQYQGVARGDLDIMVGGWLPVTHATYYAKYKNDMDDVGVIYTGGKNGWAVPKYIPESELSSISDLGKPEVKSKLNGTVQGIEPGGGLMQASEKTIKAYNLDGYNLQASSEAGMLAGVSRAYQSKQWIVATVWSPHWLFQKWQMRYLKDPKGSLGGEEQVHAFASKQFAGKFPRADVFFKHFKLTLADVESIEFEGNSTNDYATAAKKFVDAHPDKVNAWLQQ